MKENLDQAETIFKKYDIDWDGYLNKKEVLNLVNDTYKLLNKQNQISSMELDQYIDLMDKDKDGKISEYDYNMHILESLNKRDIHL